MHKTKNEFSSFEIKWVSHHSLTTISKLNKSACIVYTFVESSEAFILHSFFDTINSSWIHGSLARPRQGHSLQANLKNKLKMQKLEYLQALVGHENCTQHFRRCYFFLLRFDATKWRHDNVRFPLFYLLLHLALSMMSYFLQGTPLLWAFRVICSRKIRMQFPCNCQLGVLFQNKALFCKLLMSVLRSTNVRKIDFG